LLAATVSALRLAWTPRRPPQPARRRQILPGECTLKRSARVAINFGGVRRVVAVRHHLAMVCRDDRTAKRHFRSTAFWLRCRLHMPSATLKRLNSQHHDALCRGLVATEKDRPCRYAGHYCMHAGLECSPKLRQSVGELEAGHRHANCEPQGVLLRLSETRPRHTGRRPALSITKVQPASRALRDFAKR
jgi:hypothetical protein